MPEVPDENLTKLWEAVAESMPPHVQVAQLAWDWYCAFQAVGFNDDLCVSMTQFMMQLMWTTSQAQNTL